MARLTPAELQEAKRKRADEREAEERRVTQERAEKARIEAEERERQVRERAEAQKRQQERLAALSEMRNRHQQLANVTAALYEELKPLTHKWPTMPVTDLTIAKVNKAVRAVRDLMKSENDDFVEDINEIVDAGDKPENRDVLLVLTEMRAGLQRFRTKYHREWGEP